MLMYVYVCMYVYEHKYVGSVHRAQEQRVHITPDVVSKSHLLLKRTETS